MVVSFLNGFGMLIAIKLRKIIYLFGCSGLFGLFRPKTSKSNIQTIAGNVFLFSSLPFVFKKG